MFVVMGIFSDILSKSRFEQQPVKGNFIPRPDPKKNTTSDDGDKATVLRHGQLVKESPRPVPGTPSNVSRPNLKEKTGGKGKRVGGLFETDASTPDDSTYIIGMEKARKNNIYAIATAVWIVWVNFSPLILPLKSKEICIKVFLYPSFSIL